VKDCQSDSGFELGKPHLTIKTGFPNVELRDIRRPPYFAQTVPPIRHNQRQWHIVTPQREIPRGCDLVVAMHIYRARVPTGAFYLYFIRRKLELCKRSLLSDPNMERLDVQPHL
jgi:hypothetical protein